MSTAKFNHFQVGQNPTATSNFVLTQGADGTCKLARGNQGATTQDILTVDAAGKVTFPLPPIQTQYSMVRLNTANGYGSTNTMIRRFTNVDINQGSDITYTDSATLGASFAINTDGVYSINFAESFNTTSCGGISLNSNQLTTAVQSITAAHRLSYALTALANYPAVSSWSGYLPSGSVIRAHSDSGVAGSYPNTFTITRVS